MSYYKKIFDAVEESIYIHQDRTAEEVAKRVSHSLGIKSVNVHEIRKIIDRVATQYNRVNEQG